MFDSFQIHRFSLQIEQQRIEMHAGSLFEVDLRIYVSILLGLATYLVLFVQFSTIQANKHGIITFSAYNPVFMKKSGF
jgi:hypothetical protein